LVVVIVMAQFETLEVIAKSVYQINIYSTLQIAGYTNRHRTEHGTI
jgi:hypothetical protein